MLVECNCLLATVFSFLFLVTMGLNGLTFQMVMEALLCYFFKTTVLGEEGTVNVIDGDGG